MKKLRDKTFEEICQENNLNFPLITNIIDEQLTINKIRSTMEIIEKTLARTLGPYGSTTIIQDKDGKHFMSKDGYDVMNRLRFQDEASRTIHELIRKISAEQVMRVGDGSTSAIIVASELYKYLTDKNTKNELFKDIAPQDILNILNELYVLLEEYIKSHVKKVSDDWHELEQIATIAANNSPETGKMIKKLYDIVGEYGFITTDIVQAYEKDTIEKKDGIEWQRGFIDQMFAHAHGTKDMKIVYETNPAVFISANKLIYDDIEFLFDLLGVVAGNEGKELIIIAPGYSEDINFFFKKNRQDNINLMDFTCVDIPNINAEWVERIHDIAIFSGCKVYDREELSRIYGGNNDAIIGYAKAHLFEFVGKVDKIIITERSTQLIGSSDEAKEGIQQRIQQAKEQLNELMKNPEEHNMEIFYLKKRIASLEGTNVILHVGGKSLSERQTRERLIEDAILACRSTLKNGYIYGGNLIIPRALLREKSRQQFIEKLAPKFQYLRVDTNEFLNKFLILLGDVFLESYKNVLDNSYLSEEEIKNILHQCVHEDKIYNLKTHKFEDTNDCSIINSADTDLQILRSVISIVGAISVSNQMITINYNIKE